MPIITISRGCYSHGKQVAQTIAEKLDYECISQDIVLEASQQFNIPETKLVKGIHDAPSIMDRFTYEKERFVAYIQAALLKHVQKDNVIYHGLAGHFFLQKVPNVLKVRIIADMETRVQEEMKRNNISEEEARELLKIDDNERCKWSLALYGMDPWDSRLYDLIINIKNITIADAVNTIIDMVKLPSFETTPESRKIIDNLALASQVRAILINQFPQVETHVDDNIVTVTVKAPVLMEKYVKKEIMSLVEGIEGVKNVKINFLPSEMLARMKPFKNFSF